MHSLTLMENACERAIEVSCRPEAWMETYCQICDPASVKHVILMLRESKQRMPCTEEDLSHMAELVKGLVAYLKNHVEEADPRMDELILLARQMLSRLAL
ncbi:hypothetical protein [Noviherbaspirillum galbum]|uniref:Uncharacterized protein n=1 Tax=Noviherbaspirillum galbum TaxID=2709383 RepID=A0A6B3STT1_9BURK|nr:hypothetical protein [Noviherbaspirillum galbum]NEX64203.1 hypothetical protein [Noviherbaspirillum galbum]